MKYWIQTPEFAHRGVVEIGCDTPQEVTALMEWLAEVRAKSAAALERRREAMREVWKRRREERASREAFAG